MPYLFGVVVIAVIGYFSEDDRFSNSLESKDSR